MQPTFRAAAVLDLLLNRDNPRHVSKANQEGVIEYSIPTKSIVYIDPPYYEKGSKLYKNAYRSADHERIAERVSALANPWFMTYDNVQPIRDLYSGFDSVELDIGYSVQTKRRGSELLVVSRGSRIPVEGQAVAH